MTKQNWCSGKIKVLFQTLVLVKLSTVTQCFICKPPLRLCTKISRGYNIELFQLQVEKKSKSSKTSINKLESWVNRLQHKKRDFKYDHIQSAKNQSISTQIKENEDEIVLLITKNKNETSQNITKTLPSSLSKSGLVKQNQTISKFPQKKNQSKETDRKIKIKPKEKDTPLISSLDPSSVLTVADLETILRNNNYVRDSDLKNKYALSTTKATSKTSSSSSSSSSTAFPQPSIVSPKEITIASFITSGGLGLALGVSISPNLWLMGIVIGALYGQKIATENDGNPTNIPFSSFILSIAKQLAKWYLLAYDAVQGIWFMYKTGQLSYEYYKRYNALDQRFQLQSKVDAWNARFQEGKKNFDAWEKENEVGRKILAGLRTVWLVEEQSFKKLSKSKRGKSQYRIVNYTNDFLKFISHFMKAIWNTITRVPGHENDLGDLIKGIRLSLAEANFEILSQRFGSGIAAIVGMNLIGVLFVKSPFLIGVAAFTMGMMFPDWMAATYITIQDMFQTFEARGRGEILNTSRNKRQAESKNREKYSFFIQTNGKKRWYRTGKSIFQKS